jgi:hypothetical protein
MAKRKAKVSGERQVNMYAEMRHASRVILEKAQQDPEGAFYQWMASLVFTAFMLEAFLNYVGQNVFKCWSDLERKLSPLGKLNLITEKLGVEKDNGKRPFQTVSALFEFRNAVAHGKTIRLEKTQIIVVDLNGDSHHQHLRKSLETSWEQYCTLENAERVLEDIESICRTIHKVSGMKEPLFSFGVAGTLTTLLPDKE